MNASESDYPAGITENGQKSYGAARFAYCIPQTLIGGGGVGWIVGGILAFFLLRFLWRMYLHPANVMTRQAANMNWVWAGRTENQNGGKDGVLRRGPFVTRIDHRTGEVWLMAPFKDTPFPDYIAVERWLTIRDKEERDEEEAFIRHKAAFLDMAVDQEKKFNEEIGRQEMQNDDESEELVVFAGAVEEKLRDGAGGKELAEMDQYFRLSSVEYISITAELYKAAMATGKSPTEVATYLMMAFTAGLDQNELEPLTGVIVYLRSVIQFIHDEG